MANPNLVIHIQSLKEVIRHVAYLVGAPDFLDKYRASRGFKTQHLETANVADRFNLIYETGAWINGEGQVSSSGAGSELKTTEAVRFELAAILRKLDSKSLLDVGCGDWNWMSHVNIPCHYIGIDIVPMVIEANRRYERPGVTFQVANAITDSLPVTDVALCREVLFHLSFADGFAVLRNICRSSNRLIATSDAVWFNSNIRSGDFRLLNLRRRPYRLPEPEVWINDSGLVPGRRLGVWATSALTRCLS